MQHNLFFKPLCPIAMWNCQVCVPSLQFNLGSRISGRLSSYAVPTPGSSFFKRVTVPPVTPADFTTDSCYGLEICSPELRTLVLKVLHQWYSEVEIKIQLRWVEVDLWDVIGLNWVMRVESPWLSPGGFIGDHIDMGRHQGWDLGQGFHHAVWIVSLPNHQLINIFF